MGGERPLSGGEVALARGVFGDAVDFSKVTIRRRKWFPFQPRRVTMAPRGHLHFHPLGEAYCDDFATAAPGRQGLFIHEMTHVWQTQRKGDWYLLLHRMPWSTYKYRLRPGWRLDNYGIEQQAEIVRHAFLLGRGLTIAGAAPLAQYLALMPPGFFGANHAA